MNDLIIEKIVMERLIQFELFDKNKLARRNVNFTPPTDGSLWVRLNINPAGSFIRSITSEPCITELGNIVFQIFAPENTGTAKIKTYASKLAKHFGLQDKDNLLLLEPTTYDVGDINSWYQYNVIIPYQYFS